jgi:glycosyltransferase involved in cell wall biosynthesis
VLVRLACNTDECYIARVRERSAGSASTEIPIAPQTNSVIRMAISPRVSWNLTRAVRMVAARFPGLAFHTRRILRPVYRALTLHFVQRVSSLMQEWRDIKLIRSSTLFDSLWYCRNYSDERSAHIDPVRHYVRFGASEGRSPGPNFDGKWYADRYSDIRQAGFNPLVHYLRYGKAEGRRPLPIAFRDWSKAPALLSNPRQPPRRWRPTANAQPGVNLIAPVEYLNGLGKSARGYASSLAGAGISLNVVRWRRGFSHLRQGRVNYPTADLQAINLIHLNFDMLTRWQSLDAEPLESIVTPNRWNVAIVYWELASLQPEWADVVHRFDEIWCASSFMAESVRAASARPVRVVRPAVELQSSPRKRGRRDFGLPDNRFIFCYVADAGGAIGRKNPGALVGAYLEEFAPQDGACCLVKIRNCDQKHACIREIRSTAERRADVVLMDRSLTDDEMTDLYALIDCYVSPHRSEGLGLTILEAMHAKKPVIATSYGGPTDFVNLETALPVDYRLVEVGDNNYPYQRHYIWADPLPDSLRAAMRWAFANPQSGKALGLRGYAKVQDMFSRDRTAREMRDEIHRIWHVNQT